MRSLNRKRVGMKLRVAFGFLFAFVFTLVSTTSTFAQPAVSGMADGNAFVLAREDRTILLEPYGPNIIRVTLSPDKSAALAGPGYGIVGTPAGSRNRIRPATR